MLLALLTLVLFASASVDVIWSCIAQVLQVVIEASVLRLAQKTQTQRTQRRKYGCFSLRLHVLCALRAEKYLYSWHTLLS